MLEEGGQDNNGEEHADAPNQRLRPPTNITQFQLCFLVAPGPKSIDK